MLSKVDTLTKEVFERLQAASYHILDRVGGRVAHNAIPERLAEAGATADFDRQVARLPQGLVLWVVDRAGEEHTPFGRDPSRQARFGPGNQLAMSSSGQFALVDPQARTLRQPTSDDTVRAIRLEQALPEIDVVGALAEPADFPIPPETWLPMPCWCFTPTSRWLVGCTTAHRRGSPGERRPPGRHCHQPGTAARPTGELPVTFRGIRHVIDQPPGCRRRRSGCLSGAPGH